MKIALLAALVIISPWSQRSSREETALLEGVVIEQGTGAPIARARALLALAGDNDPKHAISASTDSAGKFALENVSPGIYQLFVGHAAYVPAEYGQRSLSKPGLPITVAAGQAIHVDVKLTPAASIHGKVTDQQGAPVSEFVVKAFRASYERGERVFRGGEYAVTETNGEFHLFGLAPGWYFLGAAQPEEYGPPPLNGGMFNWPTYYGGATEDEAQPIQLAPGAVFESGTLVTQRGPASRVRGQVLDAVTGKSAPDARVLLGRKRRRGIETSGLSAPALRTGYFELAGAAPGDYVIDAVAPSLAGSASFQARGAAIDDLTVMLYPRLRIPGHAQIESEPSGQSPAAFAAMRVVLDAGRAAVDAPIDDRGLFTLTDVPVGDYRVTLAGGPPNLYLKAARFGAEDVLETGLHVRPKSSGSLELTLGSTSGVLNVIALDAKRAPVPEAVVALVPKARHRLELYRTALTDNSGNARFERVPPGEYRVFAWEEIEENAWQDPDILRAYESRGETITLRETGILITTVTVDRMWP